MRCVAIEVRSGNAHGAPSRSGLLRTFDGIHNRVKDDLARATKGGEPNMVRIRPLVATLAATGLLAGSGAAIASAATSTSPRLPRRRPRRQRQCRQRRAVRTGRRTVPTCSSSWRLGRLWPDWRRPSLRVSASRRPCSVLSGTRALSGRSSRCPSPRRALSAWE